MRVAAGLDGVIKGGDEGAFVEIDGKWYFVNISLYTVRVFELDLENMKATEIAKRKTGLDHHLVFGPRISQEYVIL